MVAFRELRVRPEKLAGSTLRFREGPYVLPASAVPRALHGRLDLGHGQRLAETRLALLAFRHRPRKQVGFNELQVLVTHADGRAGVEGFVERVLRPRLDEDRAVVLLR